MPITPSPSILKETALAERKRKCIEKGGTWDSITQTCELPPLEEGQVPVTKTQKEAADQAASKERLAEEEKTKLIPDVEPEPPQQFGEGETIIDEETGETVGITKDGKQYFLPREDIEAVSAAQQAKVAPIAGTISTAERIQQERTQALLGQLGQINPDLQSLIEAPIDWGQAITAGTIKAAPSILTKAAAGFGAGAVAGAVGGAGVASIPLAAIGGTVGAIAAIWGGIHSNIESQKKGEVGASIDVLTAARTNMRQLAMLASQDPTNSAEYITAYNAQLSQVHRAHRQIKIETQGNLNKYIEDGTDILSDFELFLDPAIGTAKIYGDKLRAAVIRGAPQDLTIGDLPEQ